MIKYLLIVISVLAISSVKFLFAPALALLSYKLSYIESLIYTTAGGVGGLFLYAFLFAKILIWWQGFKLKLRGNKPESPRKPLRTKKLRQMVRFKNRWGLWGVAILAPVMSLPVSTFLAIRFFPRSRPLFVLIIAVVAWSLVLNTSCFFLGKSFL